MSQKSPPFEFFDILQQNMLIKPKGSSLLHFSALCDIFRKKKIFKNFKFFFKKVFCAFWALDIAPTLDVPVLFFQVLTDRTLYKTSPCRKYLDGQELDFDERKQVCYKSRSKTRYNGLSGVAPGSPLVHKSVFSSKPICLIGIANTANDSTSSSQDPSLFTRIEYYRQWISQTYEELSRLGSKCTIL